MRRRTRGVLIGTIALFWGTPWLHAQTAVCGNGVRELAEQCDDGNTNNLDGCSAQCKFEQNQRINQLKMQFGTATSCSRNAFGFAFVSSTSQSQMQTGLDSSVADGSTSVILSMLGLDDLTGTSDPAVQVGVLNASPLAAPSGVTYSGTNDLDWWYAIGAGYIDASRVPTSQLNGSIASKLLSAGPGTATLVMNFGGGPHPLLMSSLNLSTASGSVSVPTTATGPAPPGHLASEHLDPSLTSYASSGPSITGELCGNISANSLSAIPIFTGLISGTGSCTEGYTTSNTLLDVLVGGCRVLGGLITTIAATQPDQSNPAGTVYRFLANSTHSVVSCTANGVAATLSTCLAGAAYSSFFKFSTDRVIATLACPNAPSASNNGPICANQMLQLTASGPSGDYRWTGPNGFTSTVQNPTIPNVTTAAAGTYSATVTLGGCTSQAGTTTVSINAAPGTPVLTAPASAASGAVGFTASVATHTGSSYAWTITNGTITGGQGTTQVTFTAGASGSVNLSIVETNGGCSSSPGTVLVPIVLTPQGVTASAVSTSQVVVTWMASSGAASYEIARRGPGGTFIVIGTTTGLMFNDSAVGANIAYLYIVRALDAMNNRTAYSPADLATTVMFTDDPLLAQTTTVKAAHIIELRTAVGAVRSLAGLGAATSTDLTLNSTVLIKAIHVRELRAALDDARSALAVPALVYTDATLISGATAVKAAHISNLRNGVK